MNIARAIRTCRIGRQISQGDLARKASISASYLSLLEAGQKEPSFDMLRRIADALDIPFDVLILAGIDLALLRKKHRDMADLFSQMLWALVE